jgi:hypothetical protein
LVQRKIIWSLIQRQKGSRKMTHRESRRKKVKKRRRSNYRCGKANCDYDVDTINSAPNIQSGNSSYF